MQTAILQFGDPSIEEEKRRRWQEKEQEKKALPNRHLSPSLCPQQVCPLTSRRKYIDQETSPSKFRIRIGGISYIYFFFLWSMCWVVLGVFGGPLAGSDGPLTYSLNRYIKSLSSWIYMRYSCSCLFASQNSIQHAQQGTQCVNCLPSVCAFLHLPFCVLCVGVGRQRTVNRTVTQHIHTTYIVIRDCIHPLICALFPPITSHYLAWLDIPYISPGHLPARIFRSHIRTSTQTTDWSVCWCRWIYRIFVFVCVLCVFGVCVTSIVEQWMFIQYNGAYFIIWLYVIQCNLLYYT